MLKRLDFIENKYEELSIKISDPSVMADQKEWQRLCKEHAELEVIVMKYREYRKAQEDLENDKEMLREESDKELRDMIQEEIKEHKTHE
jgi:peptide chain release factor 1